jgi:hypothetical protein
MESTKKNSNRKSIMIIASIFALILLSIVGAVIYYYVTYGELPSLTNSSAGVAKCTENQITECKTNIGKTPVYNKNTKKCTCESNAISKTKESCASGYFWCEAPGLSKTCLTYFYKAIKDKCENNKCKFTKGDIYKTSIETTSKEHDGSTDGKDFIESDCSGSISGICSKVNLAKVDNRYNCSKTGTFVIPSPSIVPGSSKDIIRGTEPVAKD